MTILCSNAVRLCLSMVLSASIAMLLLAQTFLVVMPHVRVEAILTRPQMADQAYREATLAELQNAQKDLLVIGTGTAFVLMAISAIGLYFGRARRPSGLPQ